MIPGSVNTEPGIILYIVVSNAFILYEKSSFGDTVFEVISMVKGVSRQVIVVHSPDPKLFDQAIFILNDNAVESGGVSEERLLMEANRLVNSASSGKKRQSRFYGPACSIIGAAATALIWLITTLL